MKFAKLCQRLAADQNRYKGMSEKRRQSVYGRFVYRRIRKTLDQIHGIEKAIGRVTRTIGNYPGAQKPDK